MNEENELNTELSEIKAPESPFDGLTKEQELIEMKKMLDSMPERADKGELPMRIEYLELKIKNK